MTVRTELEPQLGRPRAADLIERIEAAAGAAAAERGAQHLRRLAEQRRSHVVGRGAEIGVVENIEEIGSRLKGNALVKSELPAQRQINLHRAESVQGVTSQIFLDRAAVLASQPDMSLVAEASNRQEAIEQFHAHRPDITLMDRGCP